MILKHIQWVTFRVVTHIKGVCVELPQFLRVSLLIESLSHNYSVSSKLQLRRLAFSDVLWCC
jgi:hypothetical protein